jgi:phosphatidylserine/phosphatidylglycerophosphate/cardiolipin synthase-like enzyme
VFVFPIDVVHSYALGTHYTFRWLPNIINSGGDKVTLRSLLNLANFKANHRKLVVADTVVDGKREYVSLITSANPHDGSSSHSNVAMRVKGDIAKDIISSERSIIMLAGNEFVEPPRGESETPKGDVSVSLITDRAIQANVITSLSTTQDGDTVDLFMFYLSDISVIDELIAASKRGVQVRVILDPNKDAFGMKKNGIPNREVADTLVKSSDGKIKVRWCDTQGEQCHGKMLVINSASNYILMLGSANYTRRNIGGYNLESNFLAVGEYPFEAWFNATDYFEQLWTNEDFIFSANYERYQDGSLFKKIIAWLMEATGLGTF